MSPPRRSSARRRWRPFRYLLLALLVLVAAGSLALGLGYADGLRPPLMAALSAALGREVASERLHLRLVGLTPRLTLEQVVLHGRVDPDGPRPVDPVAPTQVVALAPIPPFDPAVAPPADPAPAPTVDPAVMIPRDPAAAPPADPVALTPIHPAVPTRVDLATATPVDPAGVTRVPRLHLDLDLPASLIAGEPRLKALVLEGLRLRLERDATGQLAIAGLPLGGEGEVGPALRHFLDQGQFVVTAGEVAWLERSAGTTHQLLTGVELSLDNQGTGHRLELQAALAGEPQGGMLRLSAELRGPSDQPSAWSGPVEFFLQSNDLEWLGQTGLPPAFQVAGSRFDLSGQLEIAAARVQAFQGRLDVQALSVAGQVPAQGPLGLEAGRLELQVTADGRAGQLQVTAKDLTLRLPAVFGDRPPIRVEQLAGPLDWALDAVTGLSLGTRGLSATNPDLGVSLTFSSRVPWKTPGGERSVLSDLAPAEAELDLRGKILNASAARIRVYLPDPQLRPQARAWLDRAFPGGRVPWGLIRFQGRLADFPFRQAPGDFQVLLRVEDMALDFDPDWPRLEGLEGIVHFHNQGLAIATLGGRIHEVPLLKVQASLPDLAETRFLGIRGTAQGPFAAALAFLGASPLKTVLGAIPNLLSAEGVARVDLDMDLPLEPDVYPDDRLRLAGALSWPGAGVGSGTGAEIGAETGAEAGAETSAGIGAGPEAPPGLASAGGDGPPAARLTLAGTRLALDDLAGAVSFNAEGVTRSRVQGRFLGRPLTMDLERIRDPIGEPIGEPKGAIIGESSRDPLREPIRDSVSSEGLTGLRIAGRSAVSELSGYLPAEFLRHLEGEVPWELAVRIPDPPPQVEASTLAADFLLTSSLRGLAVKLPAPLGKAREAVRSLRLAWGVAPGEDLRVRGHYDDLALDLLFAADARGGREFRRGSLTAGQERTELPPRAGLRIDGRLARLDAAGWVDWAAGLPARATTGSPPLTVAGLRIDHLQWGELGLWEAVLDLEQGARAWEVQIESRELAGQLEIPRQSRAQPLRADIARLDLQPFLAASPPAADVKPGRNRPDTGPADPRRAWGLDLAVERLRWLDTELGRLSLRAEPQAAGLRIAEVRLSLPGRLDLQGQGEWVREEGETAGARMTLDLAAKTGDLGDLLRHLGYVSPLAEAPAEVEARLTWPGGPGDLSPATLQGEIDLAIGKGSLLDVDPGMGRVLGVLNLGALGRRLALDFTDLYDRGFVFQDIKGKLGLRDGKVELVEPLLIEGTAADVRIEGRANLLDQSLEQVATVTPSLGGGVALASAIAAGPLVGAAVLLADQASGGALDVLGRHAYDIRGPWANPEIVSRDGRAPDDRGASSGLVSPAVTPATLESDGGSTGTTESTLGSRPDSNSNSSFSSSSYTRSSSSPSPGSNSSSSSSSSSSSNSPSTAPVSPLKGNAFLDQP